MLIPDARRRSYLPLWLEFVATVWTRTLYRVRTRGAENIPATGGALLVANHISYVDVFVLQLAITRRIRFVGYDGFTRMHWFFAWLFRLTGMIPISRTNALEATRRVSAALAAGELVLVFPEGGISRTGQLMALRKGFELMARRAGVPVIPVAHDGLWGSVFSFAGNKYLWKSPRLMPTHVFVRIGAPIPANEATPARVRLALLDLGAEAFEERPVLQRYLAREIVRPLARRPWRVEVIDRTAERKPVTAAQLLGVAAVLAIYLRKNVPDRRIGVVLPPGAGGFIANLAICCAGKVPANLNFTAGRSSLEASMRMGGITTVISADAMKSKVPNFPWPEKTYDLKELIVAAGGKRAILPWVIAAWVLPNQWFANLLKLPHRGDREEAALLFTSGSSGEPKGVVLTHRNILANCAQVSSLSILPRTATLLGCLPLFHSFGFTVTLWYPMLRGCRVVTIPSPLDTRKMIDAIHEDRVTVFVGAPTFIRPLLKKAESAELKTLDLVVAGAEKLPDTLHRQFLEAFHIEILQGYGLTETTPVANVNQPHPPVTTRTAEPQIGKKLGTVGRLLPGMTARIISPDTGEELPLTEAGILCLRGANVFPGYLDDPERTAASFRDGWFVTGDIARFDEDGFLIIEGRLSRFSKIGGEMVPHGTIEQRIVELFDWDQTDGPVAIVTGVPDTTKGEAIVLLTTESITLDDLRAKLLAAGLPALWIPKQVYRVEKIPVLGTGKVDHKSCRALAEEFARNN